MRKVVGVLLGVAVAWQVSLARAEGEEREAAEGEATRVAAPPAAPRRTYDANANVRVGLIAGGSGALALFYGLPCVGGGGIWCVPIAGPVLVVARDERRHPTNSDDGSDGGDGFIPPAFVYAVAGGLGALQLAAAALVTTGALLPRREVTETETTSVTVLPMVSSSTTGVAAVGTW
ncbi:MAG: hypothetical protein K0R38_5605 [Polyangiaceae bacterium]|nr:hypothetical protein [Polyangiaceae bacterium]